MKGTAPCFYRADAQTGPYGRWGEREEVSHTSYHFNVPSAMKKEYLMATLKNWSLYRIWYLAVSGPRLGIGLQRRKNRQN